MQHSLAILFAILVIGSIGTSVTAQEPAESASAISMLERFELKATDGAQPMTVEGRVLTTAPDGVLVEDRTSTLWTIKNAQLKSREKTSQPFTWLKPDEHAKHLLAELGPGFKVKMTQHYLLAFNTTPAYAEYCSALLERFYAGFFAYWKKQLNMELSEPDSKLVVILFRDQLQFAKFSRQDVGQKTESPFGYYSIRRNRSVLYDSSGLSEDDASVSSIRRAMKKAPFKAATIVHEATHQLCFNTNLHTRYADNPVWLAEGLAMYFEAPYFGSSKWSSIGRVTDWRKADTKAYKDNISVGTLTTLTQSNTRFLKPETARDAYTEAWGLTMYLMKNREEQFARYIQAISQKSPLIWDTPEQRLQLLQETIGTPDDLAGPVRAYLKRRF